MWCAVVHCIVAVNGLSVAIARRSRSPLPIFPFWVSRSNPGVQANLDSATTLFKVNLPTTLFKVNLLSCPPLHAYPHDAPFKSNLVQNRLACCTPTPMLPLTYAPCLVCCLCHTATHAYGGPGTVQRYIPLLQLQYSTSAATVWAVVIISNSR